MLAYASLNFPSLTTTFVHNEVLGLKKRGIPVQTYSVWPSSLETSDPDLHELAQEVVDLFPLSWRVFLRAHSALAFSNPRRYRDMVFTILRQRGQSWRHRFNAWGSAYITRDMVSRGVHHIHAHFASSPASVAMAASMVSDLPFSFTAHAVDIFAHTIMLREKLKRAKFIITISEYNKSYLIDLASDIPGISEKIHIVHYGVDLAHFAHRKQVPRADGLPLILTVAQTREKKGLPYLVEACRLLKSRQINFRCVIIGGGDGLRDLQHQVKENQLQDTVQLYGPRPHNQVRDMLSQATVFVLPCIVAENGDRDGIPVSLIEAMAIGVPCVSTRVSGIPELITDGKEGILLPPRDPETLAITLTRLLADPGLWRKLEQAARKKVIDEFDLDKNVEQLLSIFRHYEVIGGEQ